MKNTFVKLKKAFTLAEVLITLVIIGVVAALTISPIINTYVESSTVAKVKKGLSILGQAKKLAEVQNGPVEGWIFDEGHTAESAAQFWNYLKPYMTVIKDCGSSKDCYQSAGVYCLNGNSTNNYNNLSYYYKIILNDGSVMFFRTYGVSGGGKCSESDGGVDNVCAMFGYDVNGDKSPNTNGKDIFYYEFSKDGVFPRLDVSTCSKTNHGFGCSGYIIQHNNMKYLH